MMWIGMLLFLGPLRTLLDFIPLVGRAGNFLIGAITFLIALFLSLVTIVVAFIAHNLLLLIAVLALLSGGVWCWRRRAAPAKGPILWPGAPPGPCRRIPIPGELHRDPVFP